MQPPMRRRIALTLAALATLGTLSACSSSTEPSGPDISGVWYEKTINGITLPVLLHYTDGSQAIIISDVLTVTGSRSSGTYTDVVTFTPFVGAAYQNVTETGTWTSTGGGNFTFTYQGQSYTATVGGSSLTANVPGATQVYTR